VALRDAELLERFRPPCARDCKSFHIEIQDFTQLLRDFIRPVKRVATSAPMSFVATMVDLALCQ
jgi:hypothetical protein